MVMAIPLAPARTLEETNFSLTELEGIAAHLEDALPDSDWGRDGAEGQYRRDGWTVRFTLRKDHWRVELISPAPTSLTLTLRPRGGYMQTFPLDLDADS